MSDISDEEVEFLRKSRKRATPSVSKAAGRKEEEEDDVDLGMDEMQETIRQAVEDRLVRDGIGVGTPVRPPPPRRARKEEVVDVVVRPAQKADVVKEKVAAPVDRTMSNVQALKGRLLSMEQVTHGLDGDRLGEGRAGARAESAGASAPVAAPVRERGAPERAARKDRGRGDAEEGEEGEEADTVRWKLTLQFWDDDEREVEIKPTKKVKKIISYAESVKNGTRVVLLNGRNPLKGSDTIADAGLADRARLYVKKA
jgi:hypothetical protein